MDAETWVIAAPFAAAVLIALINAIWQGRIAERGRQHDLDLARLRGDQERDVSVAVRMYDRRADTYAELLAALIRISEQARLTQPIIEPAPPPPPPPDQDAAFLLDGRIAAFSSTLVRKSLEEWRKASASFFSAAAYLAQMRADEQKLPGEDLEGRWGVSMGGQYKKVEDLRQELRLLLDMIRDQVAAELAGPQTGHTTD